jgi:enamine deaminase RidA (YjgF/YER057c/UK114 family)
MSNAGRVASMHETVGDLALLTWAAEGGVCRTPAHVEAAYRTLDASLREAGAVVLQERAFGSLPVAAEFLQARARATGAADDAWALPPTFVEGAPIGGEGIAGIHVIGARARASRLLKDGPLVLGRVAELPGARLLGLGDVGRLTGANAARGPAEDATAAIEAAERVLAREGLSFRDVVRTWYYLRDILTWYGPFNLARSTAFRRMGLIGPGGDGAVPASTGIGGQGAGGAWCTLDLLAAQAAPGTLPPAPAPGAMPAQATPALSLQMTRLHNRRQNEATEYGSAFARGMALTLGSHRYLFVSGTASIDHRGATVHAGDFAAQTHQTIEAIGALLEDAGASLSDIRQATAFLKDPADLHRYQRIAQRAGLDRIPPVVVAADACRENLLVEIDATAVVPIPDAEVRR